MPILPIVTAPDPVLKAKAKPVEAVTDEIRQLMDDMLETMYDAPGIGLAAPQVGVSKRIIVVDVDQSNPDKDGKNPMCFANPQIVASTGETSYDEGCLSVPDAIASVNRMEKITLKALDRNGDEVTLEADGLLSICLQHEIDHLDGVLFIDRISRLKREMIIKKLKKMKAEQSA
ncbi:peptide deformylase [Magnetofaba australis]|uniref:Peptide deformylase n=1 Tax=Magnetofaba australis IT-1 TaxID=1434232 RepID=A0A1Y2K707_9PROT|nr:peptide deformylase [Magnetofaba australis]OSM06119.1 putative peptide deformylase [Magnetofaba australis IT-1]